MITAEQLRRRRLSTTYRSDGYDAAQVDLYLDLAAETLASLEAARAGSAGAAQMLLRELRTATFPSRTSGSGYESAQVEALRAGVVAALEAHTGTAGATPTPVRGGPSPTAPTEVAPTTPTPTPVPAALRAGEPAPTPSLAPVLPTPPLGRPAPGESLGSVGTLGSVVGWGSPSGERGSLSAYELVVQLQTARTQLLGAATDRLVLRTATGELLGVAAVEATEEGVRLTTEH
ncbi:DivIVA domain-containing protein [Cellulomonas sp. NPDC055163]